MNQAMIDHVKAQGFRVLMLDGDTSKTWLIYTDGTRIGYVQDSRFGGYAVSTVHRPNPTTGMGFKLVDGASLDELTRDVLEAGFCMAPAWANSRERASVRKWGDLTAFLQANSWNAQYREI